jgi:hypothetical protein
MANRSAKIAGRIRATFGGVSAQKLPQDLIFQAMDDVQRRICEDTLCNEASMVLSVSAGTGAYDLTELGGLAVTPNAFGVSGGLAEAIVGTSPTTITWDTPFTETYTDSFSNVVPLYRFIVQEARVGGTGMTNETIIIDSQDLDSITIHSSEDNTLVKFMCVQYSAGGLTPSQTLDPSGFFRLHYIELPQSFQFQLQELSPITRDATNRALLFPFTSQNPSAFSILADVITFYPSVGSSEDYTLHYYKVPTTNLSASVDPEITSSFDTALYYGAVAELAPSVDRDLFVPFNTKYEMEIDRAKELQGTRKSYEGSVVYHDF